MNTSISNGINTIMNNSGLFSGTAIHNVQELVDSINSVGSIYCLLPSKNSGFDAMTLNQAIGALQNTTQGSDPNMQADQLELTTFTSIGNLMTEDNVKRSITTFRKIPCVRLWVPAVVKSTSNAYSASLLHRDGSAPSATNYGPGGSNFNAYSVSGQQACPTGSTYTPRNDASPDGANSKSGVHSHNHVHSTSGKSILTVMLILPAGLLSVSGAGASATSTFTMNGRLATGLTAFTASDGSVWKVGGGNGNTGAYDGVSFS